MNLLAIGIALAASGTASAQDFFFLQMSDPQFGMYTGNTSFAQESANLEFAIATANRLHPAFVIISGDLVNKPGDKAQIDEYLRITRNLDTGIPLYSVAGNHDVGNIPTPESLAAYRKTFGKDYYTFRKGSMEGIVLNSSIIQHPDKVMDEEVRQREWLEEELKKAVADHIQWIIMFQHIPWFLHDPNEPDQYFNIPHEARLQYLKILKESGVRYDFAGHLHQNSEGTDGTLEMVTTAPVGRPLGSATSGIRIISVGKSDLCHHYYGLGNLPNQIDLKAFEVCAPNIP
ncbi:metallophosphoesterase [Edaphobacter sp. HDX4]|uniref:metallophosphoesterase n=1 Tax=Edaphobacter sp. HDX4 TaxID=2794064 RepID=UPI002FE518FE